MQVNSFPDIPGVNLAGYFRAESGVGEVSRLMRATLEAAGIPFSTTLFDLTRSRQERSFEECTGDAVYDINIVCVNADQVPVFIENVGRGFMKGRYTIGVWAWEVEVLPEAMRPSGRLVQEVWGISRHAASSIAPFVECPVRPFTLPVSVLEPAEISRQELGLPEGFLFLFCFDFDSVFERKNPFGVIEAFRHAFRPGEGPSLLIKSINGHLHPKKLRALHEAAASHPSIFVRDGYLSAEKQSALMSLCDAYVSLHRAEGFGLTMAEAMAKGKPVVATAYSANLDFMDSSNSYLVPFDLVGVPPGCDPYPTAARWADPRLSDAAGILRSMWRSPETARQVGDRAKQHIQEHHTPAARASQLRQHLKRIALESRPPTSRVIGSTDPDALEKLESLLNRGPDVQGRSVFGPFGPWLRRMMLRFMRPYRLHQEKVDAAILDLLRAHRDLQERLEERESEVDRLRADVDQELLRFQGLGANVESLESLRSKVEDVRQTGLDLEESLKDLRGRMGDPGIRVHRSADLSSEIVHDLGRRLGALENSFKFFSAQSSQQEFRSDEASDRLQERVSGETRQATARTLEEIDKRTAGLEQELSELSAELYARPYVADSSFLQSETGEWSFRSERESNELESLYPRFEDVFRGEEAFIRERQRIYLDLLNDRSPVLDIGCGRGEMLDLLDAAGLEARGVDTNPGMVRRCREKGHEVLEMDGIHYLESLEPKSLGGIFCSQVVEHLPYDRLLQFLTSSLDRLRPEGILIVETVNPHALSAFKAFWVDLTHHAPIFPEVLLTLARLKGFATGRILFPLGRGELERDRRRCGEYALLAYREG